MQFCSLDDINIWCNKILPTVFDDSLSYLESIFRLKKIVMEMIQAVNSLTTSNKELYDKYQETVKELEKLQKTIDDFIKGYTIPDGTITLDKLASDVHEKMRKLVEETIYNVAKFVWFGLDDDGYFIAIIPTSWKDIIFSSTPDGELILEY